METNSEKPSPLEVSVEGGVATVTMNRPEIHNAFSDVLIRALLDAFESLGAREDVRVIVLAGRGKSFCAGADLSWMRSMATHGEAENKRDARELANLFQLIDACPKPVVGRIHGAAIGGGAGLVACCDIPIASARAKFGFSEVRLGIAPAVISPFVLAKIGRRHARELFVTGARFGPERALSIGLVNRVVTDEAALDAAVKEVVDDILKGAPGAVAACKRLAMSVDEMTREDAFEMTSGMIAQLRASPEGQEGMMAFLRRQPPSWVPKPEDDEGAA